MKKLFNITTLLVALILAPVALTTPGCTALGSISQSTIDNTATVLRGAARDGAIVAIQKNPNTQKYFELAVVSLETFITGKDYSPGAFQKVLLSVTIPDKSDPYLQITIGTAIDLYQLYFGEYVKGKVNGDYAAKTFLVAIQDGFNQALGKPVSTKSFKVAKPGTPQSSVLPRPIKK